MISLIGKKFGILLVKEKGAYVSGTTKWLCLCECGVEKFVGSQNLRNGSTQSCGCRRKILNKESKTTHGYTKTRTYRSWSQMKNRCMNPNYINYSSYGGRGIRVCDQWDKFENFLKDMGERPPGTSLDRINVNGSYESKNCRWATIKEQAQNKRKTRMVNRDSLMNFLLTQDYLSASQREQLTNNFFGV
jgi:hypothetical protein